VGKEKNTEYVLVKELVPTYEAEHLAKHQLNLMQTESAAPAQRVPSRMKNPRDVSQLRSAHVLMTMVLLWKQDLLLNKDNVHDASA
jgi:hypothetical protein